MKPLVPLTSKLFWCSILRARKLSFGDALIVPNRIANVPILEAHFNYSLERIASRSLNFVLGDSSRGVMASSIRFMQSLLTESVHPSSFPVAAFALHILAAVLMPSSHPSKKNADASPQFIGFSFVPFASHAYPQFFASFSASFSVMPSPNKSLEATAPPSCL